MFFPFRFALRCGLFVAIVALASAAPWPAVESDLPPDPAVRWGTLPNGLRYAILPNAEPKERISLRLLIAVGSLHEQDDERGLAHFIEHMAFRGTRGYPQGALVTAMQRLGLGLGPDNTAFTSPNHTIYHLELPDTRDATLREGLGVFREFAEHITFDPDLIERERGVILSEKATRDTPDARASAVNLDFLWPESRPVMRPVIGLEASIRTFTREQFVAFYDAWYRPERMAVIIVGNVTVENAERLVAETFASFAPRAPAREEPVDLIPASASTPNVRIFTDSGLVGASLSLQRPIQEPRAASTRASRTRELHRGLAFAMFRQRLEKIAHGSTESFSAAGSAMNQPFPGWRLPSVGVAGKIQNWQSVASAIEQEHRRALYHGFTVRELAEARANFATHFEQMTRSASSRPSSWLAGELVSALLEGHVFATPATLQQDVAEELAATTTVDCLREFREVWGQQALHVFVSAHPSLQITPAELASVLNRSRQQEVTRPEEKPAVKFAYTDFGAPGRLIRDELIADLDVHLAEFANGVRCNFKQTDFTADIVDVLLRVGDGKLSQPAKQPGLDYLANTAVTSGGLLQHSAEDLKSVIAGRALVVKFYVDSDACVFAVRCARRDLVLALQIIAAHLTESGYRPESLREAHGNFGTMFSGLAASPGGPITMEAPRALSGGDARFGIPPSSDLYARNLKELAAWIEPQFKRGPIEMSVVGDVTWEEASAAVARTIGALPKREPRRDRPANSRVQFPKKPLVYAYDTDPKLSQSGVAWYWPVPEKISIQQGRRWDVLAEIFAERLRVRLRDELGVAYTPAAVFRDTAGFPTFNIFMLYVEVPPARVREVNKIIRAEAEALRTSGFTEDEFLRAKQPFVRRRLDDLRTNIFWGYTVLQDAQQRPDRLAAARDRTADTAAITRAEIEALAARHLHPERASVFTATPLQANLPAKR